MDVAVPEIPPTYDGYRRQLRAFIAAHRPELAWKGRTVLRTPQGDHELDALRKWVAALNDAGYALARFSTSESDPFEQRILQEELDATGLPYVLGNPLVSGALRSFGTPAQRETYLPAMARGDHIWTQLFSEPNAGSDLTSLQTRARLDGDHYVVDGQKVWSTWGQWADFGYLLARTEAIPGPAGITAFILDMRTAGVEARPLREICGSTDFSEVFLDGVRVPLSNVIGTVGDGWRVAQASLAAERAGVDIVGGVSEPVRGLIRLARNRIRGGAPAITDGAVRQQIAFYAVRAEIHRYLGYGAASRMETGEPSPLDAPLAKIWFSELNLSLAEYALSLQGPLSAATEGDPLTIDDGSWQDRFLYARALTIAGGTNEIMRNVIAERVLGLPKEPGRGAARSDARTNEMGRSR